MEWWGRCRLLQLFRLSSSYHSFVFGNNSTLDQWGKTINSASSIKDEAGEWQGSQRNITAVRVVFNLTSFQKGNARKPSHRPSASSSSWWQCARLRAYFLPTLHRHIVPTSPEHFLFAPTPQPVVQVKQLSN